MTNDNRLNMKKNVMMLLLAALYLGGCKGDDPVKPDVKPETDPPVEVKYKTVTFSAELEAPSVKTAIADDGAFAWATGDVVSVYATNGVFYDFTYSPTASAPNAFTGSIPETVEVTNLAVYSGICEKVTNAAYNSGKLTLVLPKAGEASATKSGIPMVATFEKGATSMQFKQVGGSLKFSFENAPEEFWADVTFVGPAPVGSFTFDPVADQMIKATGEGETTVTLHFKGVTEDPAVAWIPVATGSWPSLKVKLFNSETVYYESERTRAEAAPYAVDRAEMMEVEPIVVVPSEFAEVQVPMTALPSGCDFTFETEYGATEVVTYSGDKEGSYTFTASVPTVATKGSVVLSLPDGRALFRKDVSEVLASLSTDAPLELESIDAVLAEIAYIEERQGGENSISFMHISDLHSADISNNKLAELMKATDVPFSVISGDMYFTFEMVKTARSTGKPIYVIPGNHDIDQYYGGWRAAGLYPYEPNYCFRYEHLDKWFAQSLKDYSIYGSEKACYFYYDFKAGDKTLRLIALDQYDGGTAGWNGRYDNIISQEEVDWLVDLLGKSEEVDGIVIAGHVGYGNANKGQRDINNTGEFISTLGYKFERSYDYYGNGDPYLIPEIMQAYISGKNIDGKEYLSGADHRNDGSDVPPEKVLTVSTHFSKPHTNFVGYIGGHLHWDVIEYLKDFPQQLQMLVAHGGTASGPESDDLTRADSGYVINYYVLNFDTKQLTVHRIGAKETSAGTYRMEEVFPLGS